MLEDLQSSRKRLNLEHCEGDLRRGGGLGNKRK